MKNKYDTISAGVICEQYRYVLYKALSIGGVILKKTVLKILICAVLFACLSFPIYKNQNTEYTSSNVNGKFSAQNYQNLISENQKSIGSPIELIYISPEISPGKTVKLEIKGTPNTLYDISVYYVSGKSTSSAFTAKTSDENGLASWEWKISANTARRSFRAVIKSDNCYTQFIFEIT